jgi:protein-disulfide isomerase
VTERPTSRWLLGLIALLAGACGAATVLGVQAYRGSPGDVRSYLLAHPEVLPEAMEALRNREVGKAVAANRAAIVEPFPGAVGGNPKGSVTVVAFMDYACGYCRASLPELARLVASDGDVRIVYRELPILGPASGRAAQWSLAAAQQGRFLPFHEALYAGGQLTDASIDAAAAKAGIDRGRATAAASSPAVMTELEKNLTTARALGVNATPTWVIGDRLLSGLLQHDELAKAVREARAS